MIKNKGVYAIYLSLAITLFLWVLSKPSISMILGDPLMSLNQIGALLGSVLFVWSMLLSTRAKILEDAFGGLDKVYHIHRKTGEFGLMFILLHPIAIALSNIDLFPTVFLPVAEKPPLTLGAISFWIFVYFIAITLSFRELRLKYHWWKYSHILLNVAMIIGLLHVIKVPSDTVRFKPLGLWMDALMLIGVLAGLYKSLLYRYLAARYEYVVESINKIGDVYDIRMKPVDKPIEYKSGQFVYVSFRSENVGAEEHPFCIASSHREKTLRFVIKELGDFTKGLHALRAGDKAVLYGPYGRVSEKFYLMPQKDAVFIAGGIGIAPFMALFNCEETRVGDDGRKISLYYSVRYKEEAVFDKELGDRARECDLLDYHSRYTREGDGHFEVRDFVGSVRDLENTVFYLCAHATVMDAIREGLISAGVSPQQIVLEDFDMI